MLFKSKINLLKEQMCCSFCLFSLMCFPRLIFVFIYLSEYIFSFKSYLVMVTIILSRDLNYRLDIMVITRQFDVKSLQKHMKLWCSNCFIPCLIYLHKCYWISIWFHRHYLVQNFQITFKSDCFTSFNSIKRDVGLLYRIWIREPMGWAWSYI